MTKYYLEIGKRKIDITKELNREIKKAKVSLINPTDIKYYTEKQSLLELIFNMRLSVEDKEEDIDMLCQLFTAKSVKKNKGDEQILICGRCFDEF